MFTQNKINTNMTFSVSSEKKVNLDSYKELLNKKSLSSDELITLLKAREDKIIEFLLIDNREVFENNQGYIKGTDFLIPTQSFHDSISLIEDKKDLACIVYCLSGARSNYCQNLMIQMGYKSVCNLAQGIYTYKGEMIR
ncbi:MAG: rhodanese-like domain-containing protein [Campylobacteraceae bacterium]|nr:rhodanese-like domain-containing protein [Campylobacteraceae bacterium]